MKEFMEGMNIVKNIGVFTDNEIKAYIVRFIIETYDIGFTNKEWKEIK